MITNDNDLTRGVRNETAVPATAKENIDSTHTDTRTHARTQTHTHALMTDCEKLNNKGMSKQ